MTSPIKTVAVAGTSGILGPSILSALIDSKLYDITVLSRESSKATFPESVKVIKTDYSLASLSSQLKGIDALVSVVGGHGLGEQKTWIDAAVAAGVKRVIASEYGSDTTNPKVLAVAPFLGAKPEVVKHLRSKESQGLTWSVIMNGPFFDWGLKAGFLGFDLAGQKAEFWDDGKTPFCATKLSTIGFAVSQSLSSEKYQATANQEIFISSHTTTQAEILGTLEKLTGKSWTVSHINTKTVIEEAKAKWDSGSMGLDAIYPLIRAVSFGSGLGNLGDFSDKAAVWNEKLGLPKEDLEASVKASL